MNKTFLAHRKTSGYLNAYAVMWLCLIAILFQVPKIVNVAHDIVVNFCNAIRAPEAFKLVAAAEVSFFKMVALF